MKVYAEKTAPIKLILLDVDGVLTNGGIIFESGEGSMSELKRFDIQDGMGVTLAVKAGLKVGVLTGRSSEVVDRRARELSMTVIKQGFPAKIEGWQQILKEEGLDGSEVAYMGDDIQDLPVIWRAGFTGAPANAVSEVRDDVDYVCQRSGGNGAVREFIELLLEEKGLKAKVIVSLTGKKP